MADQNVRTYRRSNLIRDMLIVILAITTTVFGVLYYRARGDSIKSPITPSDVRNIVPDKLLGPPAPASPTPPTPAETKALKDGGIAHIPPSCPECDGRCYGVQRGDTLSKIAIRFYGTTRAVPDLARVNKISDPNKIYAESCICLPKNIKLAPKPIASKVVKPAPKVKLAKPAQPVCPPCPPPPCPECPAVPSAPAPAPVPAPVPVPAPPEAHRPEARRELIPPIILPPEKPEKIIDTKIPDIRIKTRRPFILPGTLSSTFGNILPSEKGNIISETQVEQGFTLWRKGDFSVMPFVSLDTTFDSKGHDWNNRIVSRAGAKAAQTFDLGIVQGSAGYTEERRMRSGRKADNLTVDASYWFGWDQFSAERSGPFSAFPGSSWGIVGNISPVEKGNIIGVAYAQQGVTVAKIKRSSLIPFGEYLVSKDTKGYDWNNRQLLGGGLKLSVPLNHGMVVDFGAAYKHEERFKTNTTNSGLAGSVNFWLGWNPPLGR